VNKIFKLIFIIAFISACSFKDTTGFWSNEKNLEKEVNFKPLFENNERLLKEFNNNFKIKLDPLLIKFDPLDKNDNNDGYVTYKGNLKKISKYSFSKIAAYNRLEPDLIFHNDKIIFFDNRGTILKFDENSKLIWKTNNYSKSEKKINPLLSMQNNKDHLIIVDNLSKYYALNIKSGKILWSKNHLSPFNSQIKIHKDKFFVVDLDNNLICFSIKDGKKIWNFSTGKSFINSLKKLSVVINENLVIFNNSLGDITAINIESGMLEWQISTQNSDNLNEIINLKTSDLLVDERKIYFSNNKNMFYSIDLKTGNISWIQQIKSNIKPAIIGDLVFTISESGYLFVIDKNKGNIIRINDIFKNLKTRFKKKLKPIGFILNSSNLYVSTSLGKLLIINIEDAKIAEIIKVGNSKISRPFVKNNNLFLIKNNSIIKLN
jgi:outer membrane protein assembly factor BamB